MKLHAAIKKRSRQARRTKIKNLQSMLQNVSDKSPWPGANFTAVENPSDSAILIKCSACPELQHRVITGKKSSDATQYAMIYAVSAAHIAKVKATQPKLPDERLQEPCGSTSSGSSSVSAGPSQVTPPS